MKQIAVFASGKGTNFKEIALRFSKSDQITISLLIYDRKNAECKLIADEFGISSYYIDYKNQSKQDAEQSILDIIRLAHINLCVLAGFMRILSRDFIRQVQVPIVNIHPSLLPEFKGTDSIARAYTSGHDETGITIHYVNEFVDDGRIILQARTPIDRTQDVLKLEEAIHRLEHTYYPIVIEKLCEDL